MIKHVILWKLRGDLPEQDKQAVKQAIQEHLEALVGVVPGLTSLKIVIDGLESSNADVMLDSELESIEALNGYQTHPEHVKAADTYVRPYTEVRMCMDYEV